MHRKLALLVTVVLLAACTVPEVDLDLPQRPGPPDSVPPVTAPVESPSVADPSTEPGDSGATEAPSPPDPDDLDELEQLVAEIEALLEGVSDELDQISFEEEGG